MPDIPTSSTEDPKVAGWKTFLNLVRPRIDSYAHAAAWLLVVITLFRFWYATQIELVGDEAYYWLWSKNLDIGYYSKGPGIAWTIALGRSLWGDTEFGIRFCAVLLSAGTGLLTFLLARRLFQERVAFWVLVTLLGIPLYAVGSILMTIDPLSVFFWTASALLFWRAKDSPNNGPWAATGLLIGLGMLCKYTNVAELICFALFCGLFPELRSHFRRRFWIMTGVALLCLAPVLIWNARHDWITFQHLWQRGELNRPWRFSPSECFQFLASQFLVLGPFLAAGLVAAVVWTFRRGLVTAHRKELAFLLCLTLPLILFYTFLSFNDAAEANWTAPSWISGIILLVAVAQPWMDRSAAARRTGQAVLAVSLLVTVLFHAASLSRTGFGPLDSLFDRARGSADLARQVAALQQQHGATFLIANKYPTASLISFYHPSHPMVYLPNDPKRRNQFSYWPDYTDGYAMETALFVTDSREFPEGLSRSFSAVELIKNLDVLHSGQSIRNFRIYLLKEYGLPAHP
ncbi:MAG: glycosyltransferase family 39 protein [Candidatus Methylacidiphilales bacterium]|nr:glycosyltransferase family 39 protein [Candidatus Methylacidiphilales bacterium]